MILTKVAIQHKETGFYLPEPHGAMGRGGSFVEPAQNCPLTPFRLFDTLHGAKCFFAAWLKGHHVCRRTEYDGEYDERIDIIPQSHRKREEFEFVTVHLIPQDRLIGYIDEIDGRKMRIAAREGESNAFSPEVTTRESGLNIIPIFMGDFP